MSSRCQLIPIRQPRFRFYDPHYYSKFKINSRPCSICDMSIDITNPNSHSITDIWVVDMIVCTSCIKFYQNLNLLPSRCNHATGPYFDCSLGFRSYSNQLCGACSGLFNQLAIQEQQSFYWCLETDTYCDDPLYHRESLCNCRMCTNQYYVKDYGVLQDKELYEEAKKDNKVISDKARKKEENKKKKKKKENKKTDKTSKQFFQRYTNDIQVGLSRKQDYSGLFNRASSRPCVIMTNKQKPLPVVERQSVPPVKSMSWAEQCLNSHVLSVILYKQYFPSIEEANKQIITCAICLESYKLDKTKIKKQKQDYNLVTTKCNHVFCHSCLTSWLSSTKFRYQVNDEYHVSINLQHNCPECRTEL